MSLEFPVAPWGEFSVSKFLAEKGFRGMAPKGFQSWQQLGVKRKRI
jgi:hypothetical protein